jgi:chromosome segregation ATPase|tara:strand:- start:681 stop:1385 length:705 start_codon:yes stop_codon:yes gene_type:complete
MAAFLAMAGAQTVGGLVQGFAARKRAKDAERRAAAFSSELAQLEASRQDIIDPSAAIQDRTAQIQNQFGNLQVATQAAEFQAEEADIALASTLDTLRATGTGAGGATALAQAALRSKRGISATIEQQEARNVELRARGAQMAQTARLQEGGRVDRARMRGQEFMFGARELRETAKMDRVANLADQQAAIGRAERQAAAQGFGMAAGALGGVVGGTAAGQGSFGDRLSSLGYTGN